MKLYSAKDSLFCYPISHYKKLIKEHGIKSVTLYPAKKIKVEGAIFCKEFQSVGEHECGKQCHAYSPRNGKSGACKHLGSLYEPDFDNPKIINL